MGGRSACPWHPALYCIPTSFLSGKIAYFYVKIVIDEMKDVLLFVKNVVKYIDKIRGGSKI